MVEPKPQQLLRGQERHPRLLRRSVTLALVAFDARGDQVMRRALAALSTREDVVQRQVLGVLMLAAVLTPITVTNVDPGPFHRGLAVVAANVNIMPQPDNRWDRKRDRGRMQHIVPVILLDKHSPAEIKAYRPRNTDGAQRLI